MALARDLSGLPQAQPLTAQAVPYDIAGTVLDSWIDIEVWAHEEEGQRPHAVPDTVLRHSMAGRCARAVGYYAAGIPESDPFDAASILSTRNGTRQHDLIQATLRNTLALDEEVPVSIPEASSSGSADGRITIDGKVYCWELKNVGGYAYKLAVGCRPASSVAQGPKRDHVLQGALNAYGMGADGLIVTYLTWEPISKPMARSQGFSERHRFAAQWTFERDYWLPLAEREIRRMQRILKAVQEDNELPARVIPDPELPPGHRIEEPLTGAYAVYDDQEVIANGGTYWGCDYCSWQSFCTMTPSGRMDLDDARELRDK